MFLLFTEDALLRKAVQQAIAGAVPVHAIHDFDSHLRWPLCVDIDPSLAIVDLRRHAATGLDVLQALSERHATTPLVGVIPAGDSALSFACGSIGCSGILEDPVDSTVIRSRLMRVLRGLPTTTPLAALGNDVARRCGLVGSSPAIADLRASIAQVAQTDMNVFVRGETGCGKELVTRAIHGMSCRADGPLVPVNCAAIAPQIFESELFGSRRGAFTDATNRPGLLQSASGGTLFLDEITELELPLQGKLLRAVENREVRPVGSTRHEEVNVRIVAASNREMADLNAASVMRADLWYRLSDIILEVPPLRDRVEDIPELSRELLKREGWEDVRIAESGLRSLEAYHWPGNVRELRSVLVRSAALSGSRILRAKDMHLRHTCAGSV